MNPTGSFFFKKMERMQKTYVLKNKGGINMKKLLVFVFVAVVVLSGCGLMTNGKKEIDGKVAGSLQMSFMESYKEKEVVGFDKNKTVIDWTSYGQIKKMADNWIPTLKPTHQMEELPKGDYIILTFEQKDEFDNRTKFYIPFHSKDAYKNIVLKGHDNGKDVYYLLEGDKNKTEALIDYMNKNQ